MAIGKVGKNGTLNENGAFYSVQDVNVLLENSGGKDLPTPTVADAGKAVIVDEEGKYALGEGGSPDYFIIKTTAWDSETYLPTAIDKGFSEIVQAFKDNKIPIIIDDSMNAHNTYLIYNMTDYSEQLIEGQLVVAYFSFTYVSCPSLSAPVYIYTITLTYANGALQVIANSREIPKN